MGAFPEGGTRWLLYGVPGVGKSTSAAAWARRLGVSYLGLDELREHVDAPYTTHAWRDFGPLSERTAVDGFLAVRAALATPVIERLGSQSGGFVAEAAFLDPATAAVVDAEPALLVCRPETRHHERFWVHRERGVAGEEQFRAARYVQAHLITEASVAGTATIDNG